MRKTKQHYQTFHSDCTIISENVQAIDKAKNVLNQDLRVLRKFTENHPEWKNCYVPKKTISPTQLYSPVIKIMEQAAEDAQVGPMAAVAGALADRMQAEMINKGAMVAVVENGGEIIIQSPEEIIIGLVVLSSALGNQLGFRYPGDMSQLGIATSSATFGHADSLGEADAVVVFAPNAALADAAATKICNEVKGSNPKQAILRGLRAFHDILNLKGVFIVKDDFTAKEGDVPQMIKINDQDDLLIKAYKEKSKLKR